MYITRGVVHNLLVSSLIRAFEVYYQDKNAREIYLAGFVAVLQVSENCDKQVCNELVIICNVNYLCITFSEIGVGGLPCWFWESC